MLSSSVVLQPLVLLASDVLHQLRHQPDPLQHHVLQVVGHLFLLQGLDELQDHKLDQSADTGSESGSEDFLAAAILLRDQPHTLNQQGSCSTNNQLNFFSFFWIILVAFYLFSSHKLTSYSFRFSSSQESWRKKGRDLTNKPKDLQK